LVYEILVGKPAFPADDEGNVEENILNQTYTIPDFLSPEAKSLISKLVVENPEKRLSISKIKNHPFFDKIDW
jgi:serine/threonine protein kinase